MDKNKITIYDDELNEKEVQVVSLFNLKSSNKKCIMYKDNEDYYVASYIGEDTNTNKLYYDFTKSEQEEITKIYNKIVGE